MSSTPDNVVSDIDSQIQNRDAAQADLSASIQGFNPPENTSPPSFTQPAPTDHFNDIVGLSPLLMALGAIGGKFGNAHGIAMLQSTNAMMKGIVTGSAEQYADARQQYEQKYDQWRDQQRTWDDTYKAYMTAYKGRIDAQQKAVNGANAAVGIALKNANMTEKQVMDAQKVGAQIADYHSKIASRSAGDESKRIQADSSAARAATAEKEVDLKYAQLKEKVKTADSNALTAESRQLKSEADSILRQYPASGGKRPPEVETKLKGIRDSMDLVSEKMKEHNEKDYNENRGMYDSARAAIAAGADPTAVKKRVAEAGLNPDNI
jgi:hypothetical protein